MWFHAFKKTRNGAVKKNIFLFLLCASCLMLVHKYRIRPLKFFFFVYHDFNHVAFVQHCSSKGLNIVSLRNVISASVEHVSIISFFNKAQYNICELKKKANVYSLHGICWMFWKFSNWVSPYEYDKHNAKIITLQHSVCSSQ